MVINGFPLAGFNMKSCFLDLLQLPTLAVGVLDFLYTGLFSVWDSPVMNAESSFSVGSLPPVLSWYNLADFLYLACKGSGRWSKIYRMFVVQSSSFDCNSIIASNSPEVCRKELEEPHCYHFLFWDH